MEIENEIEIGGYMIGDPLNPTDISLEAEKSASANETASDIATKLNAIDYVSAAVSETDGVTNANGSELDF